jgi:hypothetical protein
MWASSAPRCHRRSIESRESDGGPPSAHTRWTRQGGALWRPPQRAVDRGRALGADASLTQEPGAAMAPNAAGATLEAAAVEATVAIDAIVAAE